MLPQTHSPGRAMVSTATGPLSCCLRPRRQNACVRTSRRCCVGCGCHPCCMCRGEPTLSSWRRLLGAGADRGAVPTAHGTRRWGCRKVSELLLAAAVSVAELDHEGAGRNSLMAAQDAGMSGTGEVARDYSELQSSAQLDMKHACDVGAWLACGTYASGTLDRGNLLCSRCSTAIDPCCAAPAFRNPRERQLTRRGRKVRYTSQGTIVKRGCERRHRPQCYSGCVPGEAV